MAYAGKGNGYAWWVGQDGNVWANVGGDVRNLGQYNGMDKYLPTGDLYGYGDDVLYGANRILDPNPGGKQNQDMPKAPGFGNEDFSDRVSGGSGGGGSTYDRGAVDFWNSQIGTLEEDLRGNDSYLANANAETDYDYNTKRNEMQTNYNRNKSEYDAGSRTNQQQLQTNKNTIADRASQGLRGLLRTLGAMGAGGSSAALYNAPELVTAQANQERSGANQTFGENQQKLDTNWGNFKIDYENDKKKLEDWKTAQYRQNEQEALSKRNDILQQLTNAYANRASAGQGYGNQINDYANQMRANKARINELDKFQKPTYDGTRATYVAPTLSSYNTGNSSITTTVSAAPQTGFNTNSSPTLAMLLGIKDRKDSNPYGRS